MRRDQLSGGSYQGSGIECGLLVCHCEEEALRRRGNLFAWTEIASYLAMIKNCPEKQSGDSRLRGNDRENIINSCHFERE